MYLLIRKCTKEAVVYRDLTALASELNLHRDTVKRMIPYEDLDIMVLVCEFVKSRRGKK